MDSINANNFEIMMERDTIILEEINFNPFYDFNTIKEIVRNKPTERPFIIKGVNENIEDVIWQKPRENPRANIIRNPVQSLYNRFNRKARLKRKLEKNRRKYGENEL